EDTHLDLGRSLSGFDMISRTRQDSEKSLIGEILRNFPVAVIKLGQQ
ncbi:MAG: hypothetical protein JWO78_989, partial [Micavibrio sp.]|nr:hypothetical protein [Micavibrio sp.]